MFNELFAYSTDVVALGDDVLDRIAGVPLWIVEALRDTPHQSHSHYDQTFDWIDRVKPERAVLTHLGLEADYETLRALCPPRTEPGVDGMVFELE
jgi:phosphoribosyl 1,2-cyclic phosphate phosphodiesterase